MLCDASRGYSARWSAIVWGLAGGVGVLLCGGDGVWSCSGDRHMIFERSYGPCIFFCLYFCGTITIFFASVLVFLYGLRVCNK